jgi:hypothetical protein
MSVQAIQAGDFVEIVKPGHPFLGWRGFVHRIQAGLVDVWIDITRANHPEQMEKAEEMGAVLCYAYEKSAAATLSFVLESDDVQQITE